VAKKRTVSFKSAEDLARRLGCSPPPSMKDFEKLISDAKCAARAAGFKKSDIKRAIKKARSVK
jgi:hypothetical protein